MAVGQKLVYGYEPVTLSREFRQSPGKRLDRLGAVAAAIMPKPGRVFPAPVRL